MSLPGIVGFQCSTISGPPSSISLAGYLWKRRGVIVVARKVAEEGRLELLTFIFDTNNPKKETTYQRRI